MHVPFDNCMSHIDNKTFITLGMCSAPAALTLLSSTLVVNAGIALCYKKLAHYSESRKYYEKSLILLEKAFAETEGEAV